MPDNITVIVEDNQDDITVNVNNTGENVTVLVQEGSIPGVTEWGNITGNISNQTDLQSELDLKANASSLSTVATTGDYNDLSNKPDIPNKTSDLTNDSGFITSSEAPVQSVNTKTGNVVLGKSDIGLGNVNNTSDVDKPISNLTQSALDDKIESVIGGTNITIDNTDPNNPVINSSSGGSVDSVNGQTGNVVLDADDIDDNSTSNKFATQSELDQIVINGNNLTNHINDTIDAHDASAISYDNSSSGLTSNEVQSAIDELDNEINSLPTAPVDSVNSQTGVVVLDTDDINEGLSNLYFTDARVSSNATVISNSNNIGLNTSAIGVVASDLSSHESDTNNPHSTNASDVGLGNVDNTSDANKPISTATQTALNLKANSVDLSTVATSGNYNDLSNTPTIPTQTSDLTNDSGYITSSGAPVQQVNGQTGNVVLDKSNVGLSNVDNTSDLNKPVSTATQSSLDGKLDSVVAGTNVTVDNTDPNNPVINASGGSSSQDVFFAELNASFTSSTSWQDVPLAAASRSNGSYTHSSSSAEITLSAGDYEVHYGILGDQSSANNRVESQIRLLLDSVEYGFDANYSQRNNSIDTGGVNSFHLLVGVTSSQVLKLQTKHAGSVNTIVSAKIYIKKVD